MFEQKTEVGWQMVLDILIVRWGATNIVRKHYIEGDKIVYIATNTICVLCMNGVAFALVPTSVGM